MREMGTAVRSFCTGVAVVGVTVGLAGCSAFGGKAGVYEFTYGQAADMAEICDGLFGTVDQVSEKLDVPLSEGEPTAGVCTYRTATGGTLFLVADEEEPDTTISVKGDEYWVGVASTDLDLQALIGRDAMDWLRERANGVQNDFDAWLGSLPKSASGWAVNYATAGLEFVPGETSESQGTMMSIPDGTVSVGGTSTVEYALPEGGATVPADGERFVVARVDIQKTSDETKFTVEVDGKEAPTGTEVLGKGVETGSVTLLVSVPEGSEDVDLVATTGEAVQRISLLDGVIDDGGLSEQLATRTAGEARATVTKPQAIGADGKKSYYGYLSSPYTETGSWTMTPWDGKSAPDGQVFLTLALDPGSTTNAEALGAGNAKAIVNGTDYAASDYKAETYTYTFLIPAEAPRVDVSLDVNLDPAKADWYGSPGTYDAPLNYTWSIDPNAVGRD